MNLSSNISVAKIQRAGSSLLIGLSILLIGYSTHAASNPDPIVVSSKIDTEGGLLGNIIMLVLDNAHIPYVNKIQLGDTKIVRESLLSGSIDIYPEYTGNGAFLLSDIGNPAWQNWEQGYQRVKALDAERNHLAWLGPAPANNTWAIAISSQLSNQYNVHSMTELAKALNAGMPFKLAATPEFVERHDALPNFEQQYQFTLGAQQLVTLPANTSVFLKMAAENTSNVNAALVYGTDGAISALGFTVLADPKGSQPVYAPTPVVRQSVLDSYPQLPTLLDPVFSTLDTPTLQRLNAQIAIDGLNAQTVARQYLKENGVL
jgi:osmoprotectant transport system substrate-binding protein